MCHLTGGNVHLFMFKSPRKIDLGISSCPVSILLSFSFCRVFSRFSTTILAFCKFTATEMLSLKKKRLSPSPRRRHEPKANAFLPRPVWTPLLQRMKHDRHSLWNLLQAYPQLLKSLPMNKWELILVVVTKWLSPLDLLTCRAVCSAWNAAIDEYLEQDTSFQLTRHPSQSLRPARCWNYNRCFRCSPHLPHVEVTGYEDLVYFSDFCAKSRRSPFPGRTAFFLFADEWTRNCHFLECAENLYVMYSLIASILERFGRELQHVALPLAHFIQYPILWGQFRRLLRLIPNVRYLKLVSHPTQQLWVPWLSQQTVQEMQIPMDQEPPPPLPHLDYLDLSLLGTSGFSVRENLSFEMVFLSQFSKYLGSGVGRVSGPHWWAHHSSPALLKGLSDAVVLGGDLTSTSCHSRSSRTIQSLCAMKTLDSLCIHLQMPSDDSYNFILLLFRTLSHSHIKIQTLGLRCYPLRTHSPTNTDTTIRYPFWRRWRRRLLKLSNLKELNLSFIHYPSRAGLCEDTLKKVLKCLPNLECLRLLLDDDKAYRPELLPNVPLEREKLVRVAQAFPKIKRIIFQGQIIRDNSS